MSCRRLFMLTFCGFILLGQGITPLMAEAGDDARKQLIQASLLKVRGEIQEAANLLLSIVNMDNLEESIRDRARLMLVDTLIDHDTETFEVIHEHLALLTTSPYVDSDTTSRLNWRLTFKTVRLADAEEAPSVWRNCFVRFGDKSFTGSPEVFEELDRLVEALEKSTRQLFTQEILTDLMTTAPSIPAMRGLQWRRIALFERSGQMDGAAQAAGMDVLLAIASDDEPLLALQRHRLLRARMKTNDAYDPLSALFIHQKTSSEESPPWIDANLFAAAKNRLANAGNHLSARSRLFLSAISSLDRSSISELETSVKDGDNHTLPGTELELNDRLAIVCIHGGAVAAVSDFCKRLESESKPNGLEPATSPSQEGSAPTSAAKQDVIDTNFIDNQQRLDQIRKRLANWAAQAKAGEEKDWENALLVTLVDSYILSEQRREVVAHICRQNTQTLKPDDEAVAWIESFYGRLNAPSDQREAVIAIAQIHFDAGRFPQCLDQIQRADELIDQPPGEQNFDIELKRTLSLAGLGELKKAREHLLPMRSWRGDAEQEASVEFLEGWICLKERNHRQALGAFRIIVDRYPQSSYAAKAEELIKVLESQ